MPTSTALTAALARIDADAAASEARYTAMSAEQRLEVFLAGQRERALANIVQAKRHKAERAAMDLPGNPVSAFLYNPVPSLIDAALRHRKSAHRAADELRTLRAAQAQREAA